MPFLHAEWEFMQPPESCKMAEVVSNRFRAWINEILRQLASPSLDWDSQESVFYRVETLYNTIVRFDGVHGIDDVVNHLLREVRDLLSFLSLSFSAHVAERLFTGQRGRPKYISVDSSSKFCTTRRRLTALSRGVQEELLPSAILQLSHSVGRIGIINLSLAPDLSDRAL